MQAPATALGLLVLAFGAAAPRASGGDFSVSIGASGRHGGFFVNLPASKHYRNACYPSYPSAIAKRVWVPGRYELRQERLWVAGSSSRVWIEPLYSKRYDSCGRSYLVLISAGRWEDVCSPGHYETRTRRVWRDGCWETAYRR